TAVQSVSYVNQTIGGNAHMMNLVELRVARALRSGSLRRAIVGPIAIGAPMAFIGAVVGIEKDYPPVPVSVRYKNFIGLGVNHHIRRLAEIGSIVTIVARSSPSDLQQKLSLAVEFQDLIFAGSISTSACNPHIVLIVDIYTVLVI